MSRSCKMTRMHFELIAGVVADLGAGFLRHEVLTPSLIAGAFASALRMTNPQFNSSRFIEACIPEPKK